MRETTQQSFILLPILLALSSLSAFAVTSLPLPAEGFEVNGRTAFVMPSEQPAKGAPWVWYAPTLRAHPDSSHAFYFESLLAQGVAIAGYDLGDVRGSARSSQQFTAFYDAMVEKGYSTKPILLGQSRGGLMMLCWAFRNPGKVGAFAGIYPVCNLTSWPLQQVKGSVLADYGLSEEELMQSLATLNPPENLAGLAENGVPMFMVHGDVDTVVPYEENSGRIKEAYEQVGGEIEVKVVPGKGHEVVPEFFHSRELLEFIFEQAGQKQQ